MQCIVVIPYWCFRKAYWSHLQGSKKSKNNFLGILYLDFFTREDWADWCPETLVRNYHYMLHNIPEEGRFHLLSSGNLKSCLVRLYGEATLHHIQKFERFEIKRAKFLTLLSSPALQGPKYPFSYNSAITSDCEPPPESTRAFLLGFIDLWRYQ